MFGGYTNKYGYMNDIKIFNFKDNTFELIQIVYKDLIPQIRANHKSVIYQNNLYVFGGIHFNTKLDDFWKFDLKSK